MEASVAVWAGEVMVRNEVPLVWQEVLFGNVVYQWIAVIEATII